MAESTGTASGSSNTNCQSFSTIERIDPSAPNTEWTQFELTVEGTTAKVFTPKDQDDESFRSEIARLMRQPVDAVSATKVASYKADFVAGRWGAEYFAKENETAQGRRSMCSSSPHELEDGSGRRCPLGSVPNELIPQLQAEKEIMDYCQELVQTLITDGIPSDASQDGGADGRS
ncbi:hypothetical protein B9479_002229 [Cryptococcus floricola]|uniref:Uncharacterized protein n=1 Tax=Cryptococcus floricola TaxID=2591691 RepID=A0A5D3B280_9TREE|nr:hypothetical protein B9479_002229 [Cryptococcus floricola]